MQRRQFIAGAAAAAAFAPSSASAAVRCSAFNPYTGIQQCEAGIPSLRIHQAAQKCPQWCWAACIQMIFAKHGHIVSQGEIVQRLFGDLRCNPANGRQIVSTINSGDWRDSNRRRFRPRAYTLADFDFGMNSFTAAADAANSLARGYPLINGALGHATVMTAMTYLRDRYGRGQVQSITVRDPYPDPRQFGKRRLTAQEAYGTRLLVAVDV